MTSSNEVEVLHAVVNLYKVNGGWPVSISEICGTTRLSRSVVHLHLGRLVERGDVEKGPGKMMGWRPANG